MNGQYHLIRCRGVIERFVLIPQPKELLLAITLTDVGTEFDKRVIDRTVHGIRLTHIAGTFDGDCPLVIGIAGRTPAAVLFLDTK